MTTWNKGFVPLGILFLILGGLGILFRLAIGGIEQSVGEVLYFLWPVYFLGVSFAFAGLGISVGKREAGLFGLRFHRTSEVVSILFAVVFSLGFGLGVITTLVTQAMDLPNATVQSQVWTWVAVGTSIVCGGVAAPTLAGGAMLRLGLSRSLIMFLHIFLFIAGILVAIIVWRYGWLEGTPLLLAQVVGALCATPLGALVFRVVTPRA